MKKNIEDIRKINNKKNKETNYIEKWKKSKKKRTEYLSGNFLCYKIFKISATISFYIGIGGKYGKSFVEPGTFFANQIKTIILTILKLATTEKLEKVKYVIFSPIYTNFCLQK